MVSCHGAGLVRGIHRDRASWCRWRRVYFTPLQRVAFASDDSGPVRPPPADLVEVNPCIMMILAHAHGEAALCLVPSGAEGCPRKRKYRRLAAPPTAAAGAAATRRARRARRPQFSTQGEAAKSESDAPGARSAPGAAKLGTDGARATRPRRGSIRPTVPVTC